MITIADTTLPLFRQHLTNLASWLEKADDLAKAKGFDGVGFVEARLAPDMLPLKSQVRIACDAAKFCVARLAGVEAPKHEDNEVTLADLHGRVGKCLAFIESVKPDQLKGSDDKHLVIPVQGTNHEMTGQAYVMDRVLPNFFFHVTTAYALLRHNGVGIGKADFLRKA
jgi:uncharacterized protein